MNTVETLEYHESCPGCGASNDGTGVCPYCGSSMIKSRRISKSTQNPADAVYAEDMGLAVVKAKSGEVNSFLKIFCPLFGGIFIAVPTILFFAFLSFGLMEFWLVGFFSLFWIIGFGSLVPLIASISRNRKCKSGKRLRGIVRGYSNSNISINGAPALNIRIRVEDAQPFLVQFNTGETSQEYPIGAHLFLRMSEDCVLIEGPAA